MSIYPCIPPNTFHCQQYPAFPGPRTSQDISVLWSAGPHCTSVLVPTPPLHSEVSLLPDHLNPSLTPLCSGYQCPNVLTRQLYPTQASCVLVSSCPHCTGVSLCPHCTGMSLCPHCTGVSLCPHCTGVSLCHSG